MKKCILALVPMFAMLLTQIGIAQAATYEVEVGGYNVAGKTSHDWNESRYGDHTSLENDKGDVSASGAGRLVMGNEGGMKLGIGVRTGDGSYTSQYGAAATADKAANDAAIADAQDELAGLDETDPTDAAAIAEQQAIIADRTADNADIEQRHHASKQVTGASLTVMKETILINGNVLGLGSEVFLPSEGGAVPAARITYGAKHGAARWDVVGYAGDDWAGAGLAIKF